jgi:hypothetical protein
MDPVVGLLLLTRWVYARGWVKDGQECREMIDSEVVGLAKLWEVLQERCYRTQLSAVPARMGALELQGALKREVDEE